MDEFKAVRSPLERATLDRFLAVPSWLSLRIDVAHVVGEGKDTIRSSVRHSFDV